MLNVSSVINCVRMYDTYREYLAFALAVDSTIYFNADTVYLSLYSNNVFTSDSIKYSFVELADTSLWINDFYYQISHNLLKPTYDSDLVVPSLGQNGMDLDRLCSMRQVLDFFYNDLKVSFGMEFSGKTFINMLTPEWLMQIVKYYYGDNPINGATDIILDQIADLSGDEGWARYYSDYLSIIKIGKKKLITIYQIYDTWQSVVDHLNRIIEATGKKWEICTGLDKKFINLWCENRSTFPAVPFGSNNQDQVAEICEAWRTECGDLRSDLIISTTFALNIRNEQLVCGECALDNFMLEKMTTDGAEGSVDDWDGDGEPNITDNCPCVENSDQTDDYDAYGFGEPDGKGDACQDFDGDGVLNAYDNCPREFNPDQEDEDGDGVGDICESLIVGFDLADCFEDSDGDGIVDCVDLCPDHPSDQDDMDHDGVGDECDNCNEYWNPNQSFNPCDSLTEPEINPDCSQEDIDEEWQVWNDFTDCLSTVSNNYSRPEPLSSDVQVNPYLDEPRACIQSRIAQLGNDVLCSWWSYNPALQLVGNAAMPVWGNYDFTCSDVEPVDLEPYSTQIQDILTCCKSQWYLPDIESQIVITERILACIPDPIPEFQCVHLKLSFQKMREVYEATLVALNARKAITEAKINGTCN